MNLTNIKAYVVMNDTNNEKVFEYAFASKTTAYRIKKEMNEQSLNFSYSVKTVNIKNSAMLYDKNKKSIYSLQDIIK